MKRILCILTAFVLILTALTFSSCGDKKKGKPDADELMKRNEETKNDMMQFVRISEIASISSAFNDDSSLKDFELQYKPHSMTDSFNNCPVEIADVMPKYENEEEAQKGQKKEQAEEEKLKPAYHLDELQKTIDTAWQKLADSGAIPEYSRDAQSNATLQFEDRQGAADELVFNDKSVKDRLYAEPDYEVDQVIVMTYDDVLDENEFKERSVTYYNDCRYIVVFEGFKSAYSGAIIDFNNLSKGEAAYDITTLVYVIDAKTKEILTIHNVGTSITESQNGVVYRAKVLGREAREYLYFKLLA